jgi:hypothetical protein
MESWARIRDFPDLFADIGGMSTIAAPVAEAAEPEPAAAAAAEPEPETVSEPEPVVEPEPEPVAEPEPEHEAFAEPEPVAEPEPQPVASEATLEPESAFAEPEPEPAFAEPEPVTSEPEPAFAEPEPVTSEPEPAFAEPEPAFAEPEPVTSEPELAVAEPEPVAAEPEVAVAEPEPVAAPEPVVEAVVAPEPGPMPGLAEQKVSDEQDEQLDAIFGELIEESWEYLREHELASQIDEVFLGAVITGAVDGGYSLIDLTSDGTHHFLRFENLNDSSRLVFRLKHLTGDVVTAKVVGQRASVVIGYGEKAANIGQIMSALKAEFKSGFIVNPEPGTITVDGDLTSGYVYCQVDMFWKIDDYITGEYIVSTEKLMLHITACRHALRKYLRGRFS